MRSGVMLALLCGCGRIGFAPSVATDGGNPGIDADDSAVIDTAQEEAACVPGPWTSDFDVEPSWSNYWDNPTPSGARAMVTGGVLELTPSMTALEFAGIVADTNDMFRDRAITIDVPQVTNQAITFFSIDQRGEPWVRIRYDNGVLQTDIDLGVTAPDRTTRPYDAVAHRFWRLRERNGMTYFEASPTAQFGPANVLLMIPTPSFTSDITVAIAGGADTTLTDPGVARIDSIADCVW